MNSDLKHTFHDQQLVFACRSVYAGIFMPVSVCEAQRGEDERGMCVTQSSTAGKKHMPLDAL